MTVDDFSSGVVVALACQRRRFYFGVRAVHEIPEGRASRCVVGASG